MEFRQAREEDLGGILALYHQLNPEDPALDYASALSIWKETEALGCTAYFVAAEGDAAAAACCVTVVPNLTRGGRPYAMVENVVTDSGHRREGLGARVVRLAVERARERGCYKVVLLSGAKRIEAHSFYKAIGFDGDSKRGFEIRFA
jgi:GNAT superfamily N-acetyltransferase